MTSAHPTLLVAEDHSKALLAIQRLGGLPAAPGFHPVCNEAELGAARPTAFASVILAGAIGWQDPHWLLDLLRQWWPRTRTLFLYTADEAPLATAVLQAERVAYALRADGETEGLGTALELVRREGDLPATTLACLPCIAASPTGFFRCLPDGRILDGNAALARLLGYPDRAQLLVAAPRLWPAAKSPRSDEAHGLCDLALPHREGRPCWGRLFVQPRCTLAGEVVAFDGWAENAARTHLFQTALHRVHQRYRQLLNALPVPVMIGNREGIITESNTALERLSGYRREEIIGEKHFFDFAADQSRKLMARYHQLRHSGKTAPTCYEFGFQNRAGEIRPMRLTARYLPEEQRTIAVGEDLADQARKERGLKLLTAALAHAVPEVFPALAANLSAGLDSAGALIARLAADNPLMLGVLAAARDGRSEPFAPFPLHDSACEELIHGHLRFFHQANGARTAYPRDPWLASLEADTFLGLPLIGTDGRRFGAIVLAYRRPVKSIRFCKTLLQLAATRVVAETTGRPGAPRLDRPGQASPRPA